jgi:hypothetical protein
MSKTAAKASRQLPKHAPRKSGRRGIGPQEEGPAQNRLPGMEDPKIAEIERAIEDYASLREQRQALTAEEVPAKQKLLDLMHANKKTSYFYNGIKVEVIVEKEKVRVRIKKEQEE